jgi:hypothetical protein
MTRVFPALHVGQGTHVLGLSLFPVWVDAPARHEVSIGAAGGVSVSEREGSPVVGELVALNERSAPVLLLEGEMLEGGWQNRTLSRSVLLMPGERRVVEVCCVEQGRWHGGGDHRGGNRRVAPSVVGGLRHPGRVRQATVWNRVQRYEPVLGRTATASYAEHLDRVGSDASLEAFRPLDGQRGVIVGIMGAPVVLELFPSHEALVDQWRAIVQAAALDARLGAPLRTTGAAARYFAERVERTDASRTPEGIAYRVRSDRPGMSVRAIGLGDSLVHSTALNSAHPLLVGV